MTTGLCHKTWLMRPTAEEAVDAVALGCGLSRVTARLLANRGITSPETAGIFLNPSASAMHDPFLMKDMPEAVDKLLEAVGAGRSIAVYGDYDVDGITATVILVEFLRSLGADVHYFIPERLQDGYGVKEENLTALKRLGADLVITVDCGISSRNEVRLGRQMGLDFIITDHHPSPTMPEGVPVLNPQRQDCPYPCKDLAGAGVVFKFIQGAMGRLASLGGGPARVDIERLLEIAAIGTIGDVVPLTGENRVIASLGLAAVRRSRRPGLAALKNCCVQSDRLTSASVAFQLAPRLNASGRLGKADRGVRLLLENDPEKARSLALELNEENRYRQKLEAEILRESRAMIEADPAGASEAIVLAAPHWHPGVIGVVASRLVDMYHRPTVLISGEGDLLKGSIRSIPECPLPDVLAACGDLLTSYGGHRLAAGFVIDGRNLEAFRRRFAEMASRQTVFSAVRPTLAIDMELSFRELKSPLMSELSALEPFGFGNPSPVFLTRKVRLTREPEVFGEKHLRLFVSLAAREIKAVGFNMGHLAGSLWMEAPADIVYTPEMKYSGGQQEIVLNLKDISVGYQIEHDACPS